MVGLGPEQLSDLFRKASYAPTGWSEGMFTNPRGVDLRYGFVEAADPANKRGTIVMTHGYGEHIELYYESIAFYRERGFDVWMMEWQGHGRSDRHDPVSNEDNKRPGPHGMLTHKADLEYFTKNIVQAEPGLPVIMSTNSMGGHIGLLALEDEPELFDGAIMSTPMFDIFRLGLPPVTRPLVRELFNLAAQTPLAHYELPGNGKVINFLTGIGNDIKEGEINGHNFRQIWNAQTRDRYPENQVPRPTPAWVASAYDTIVPSLEEDFLSRIRTPMLVGSGGKDNLVDNHAHARVANMTQDTELVILPTAAHSLWFEGNGNYRSWTQHIDRFLDRIAPQRQPRPDIIPPAHDDGPHPAVVAQAMPLRSNEPAAGGSW